MDELINTVLQGDCLEVLKTFENESVDLTVTSPPYDNLRTYNGYTFDFEGIAKELYRVTKKGGVVVWIVGDATIKGSETGTSFKQALYFKEIGFNLHDTMIYKKKGSITGGKNSYLQIFEYMFIFSKGIPNTINILRDRVNTSFEHKNKYQTKVSQRHKDGSVDEKKNQKAKEFGKRFNIWEYSPVSIRWECINKGYNHPAIFPEKLAEDHILSWSNEGDIVLDPFAGSGTTLKMAKKNNRKYVGIEISQEYIEIIKKRLHGI